MEVRLGIHVRVCHFLGLLLHAQGRCLPPFGGNVWFPASRLALRPQTSSFCSLLSLVLSILALHHTQKVQAIYLPSLNLLPPSLQVSTVCLSLLGWKNRCLPHVPSHLLHLFSVSSHLLGTVLHHLYPLSCPFHIKYVNFSIEETSP